MLSKCCKSKMTEEWDEDASEWFERCLNCGERCLILDGDDDES